jgi:hypothetical protein
MRKDDLFSLFIISMFVVSTLVVFGFLVHSTPEVKQGIIKLVR